jgi:lysosomal acid lipase/cholesteryl ester hydrolase
MFKFGTGALVANLIQYIPDSPLLRDILDVSTPYQDFDDRYHDAKQIVEENGLPFESHTVTTSDGFKLGLHRIANPGKPVVFLQHGLAHSSDGWVFNSPSINPAFILYRRGYDVWMGNNRGNIYSMQHTMYSSDQPEFWDSDFEQMGVFDLPAMIDFALKTSGQPMVHTYIGHSEGTTQMFIGNCLKPDYFAQKVKMFVALAPVVRMNYVSNKMMAAVREIPPSYLKDTIMLIKKYNFMPRKEEPEK